MKKLLLLSVLLIEALTIKAQTITYTATKHYVDSVLYEVKENYQSDGTFYNPSLSIGSVTWKINASQWNPDRTEFEALIDAGATLSQTTLVLRIPRSAISGNVSASMSNRTHLTASGTAIRTWGLWFLSTGIKYDENYVYVLTKDHTGKILTGAEIQTLLDLSGSVELMGQSDAEYTNL